MVQQVPQGQQAGARALQHGDTGPAQFGRRVLVDGTGQAGQHGDRLGGAGRRGQHRAGIGTVAVEFADQVDGQRDGGDCRIVGQRAERVGELALGIAAGAPDVERVGRLQAGIEHGSEPGQRRLADRRVRHAEFLGEVRRVRALEARVMHCRDPGPRRPPRPDAAADGEQLEGVRQLGQVAGPVHPVGVRERLPAAVLGGQRARVGRHHRPARRRAAHCQQHHRDVPGGGSGQHRPQPVRLAHRLQYQGEHPGLRQAERVLQVGGGGGDEFLAGGDREGESDRPAAAQHRGEHRARMRDQRDWAGRQLLRLDVADRPQAPGHVDESHAAGPAQLHARSPRDRGQALTQVRLAGQRVLVRVSEDHRRGIAAAGGQAELLLKRGVGDAEQYQVGRPGQVGERRVAVPLADLPVPGIDQVDVRPGRAPGHLGDHPLAEAARPRRGADQRDAGRFEHRLQHWPLGSGSREGYPFSRL